MGSFLRKYQAISGFNMEFLETLFDFNPVMCGTPVTIRGAEVTFRYSLHPIPAIGFVVKYKGESLYYSGDTRFDPELGKKLAENGNIKEGRKRDLNDSLFEQPFSLVLHEAGVPPIHTPISVLAKLPESVKDKLYLVHVNQKGVGDSGLKVAKEWSTMVIPLREEEENENKELQEIVDAILSIPLFFPLTEAGQDAHFALAKVAKNVTMEKGDVIFEKGSRYDRLIILTAGMITEGSGLWTKEYKVGDHVGELCLCDESEHNIARSKFTAQTNIHAMVFDIEDLKPIMEEVHDVMEPIVELALRRKEPSWDILAKNSVFERTSDVQRLDLQDMMTEQVIPMGETVFTSGEPQPFAFFILKGRVDLHFDPQEGQDTTFRGNNKAQPVKGELGSGALVCDVNNLLGDTKSWSDVKTLEETTVLTVDRLELHEFLTLNPGIIFSLMDAQFVV